jgi:hypothetical protein
MQDKEPEQQMTIEKSATHMTPEEQISKADNSKNREVSHSHDIHMTKK